MDVAATGNTLAYIIAGFIKVPKVKILNLSTEWKLLAVTNTIVYNSAVSITALKSFIPLAPRVIDCLEFWVIYKGREKTEALPKNKKN